MLRTVLRMYPQPRRCRSVLTNAELSPTSTSLAATVPHGLELGAYLEHLRLEGGHLAFVGRVCAEKGLDTAIMAARSCGRLLHIAAKVDPMDVEYFETSIEPLLGDDTLFVGEIGEDRKPDFFASAAATLFPINWPEPFGIVMIESLAAGTPVIALRNGSVPEILRDGVTGFICDSADELGDAWPGSTRSTPMSVAVTPGSSPPR